MPVEQKKIELFYQALPERIERSRQLLGRPLTFTEKILYSHCQSDSQLGRLSCHVDGLAMHDVRAQMALMQWISTGKKIPLVPTVIYCDRLVSGEKGAQWDLQQSYEENREIFGFLEQAAAKYGLGFWEPGSGIMHPLILENEAFPGGMMLATDFHAPHAGGLGMAAINVAGSDIVEGMLGLPFEMDLPKVMGIHLKGYLKEWATPKDVILKILSLLGANGAQGWSIEFFGQGCETLSCTGKATICNMSAELGAITAVFPYDRSMKDFLIATNRKEIADYAENVKEQLKADAEAFYEQIVEIDLSILESQISGPFSSDRSIGISEFATAVKEQAYPEKLSLVLIGSCVNSSYEDMSRAATVVRQALKHGLKSKVPLMILLGSEQIKESLARDGVLAAFEGIGAILLSNSCGPSIGNFKRSDVAFGERNVIVTSFNRNSSGFNDSNPGTHAFISSPEMAVAMALAGHLYFNPLADCLINAQGLPVRLLPPIADPLPLNGFVGRLVGYHPPVSDSVNIHLSIDSASDRLQLLEPFKPNLEKAFSDLRLLIKTRGKCTIDQISPVGKWSRHCGHLDYLSHNLFSLASNEFCDEIGRGKHLLTGGIESIAKVARDYKKEEIGWIIVGDDHYGEGPLREHAAMEVRYLGGRVVIAKSFAHQHETHLKKQGVLTLTFVHGDDRKKIREDDLIDLLNLENFAVNSSFELLLRHADGTTERLPLTHSYTEQQIHWFFAGSLLNV